MRRTASWGAGRWLIVAAAAAFAALAAVYYLSTGSLGDGKADVRAGVQRGLGFLAGVNVTADTLTPSEQALPGDERYGGLSELALYRKTDFMLDLAFIGDELDGHGPLAGRVVEARGFLAGLAAKWRRGTVDYAYYDAGGKKGDYAFDLYCMVALQAGDGEMSAVIRSQLKADKSGWSTAFAQPFRVIIDESWCAMALASAGEPEGTFAALVDAKVAQLARYRARGEAKSGEVERMRTSYAGTHVLMVLAHLRKEGYGRLVDGGYFAVLQQQALSDAEANPDSPDYLSNSLYFLARSGYPKERLGPLALALSRLQQADGGWKSKLSPDSFRGLLTARAVLALNAYQEEK